MSARVSVNIQGNLTLTKSKVLVEQLCFGVRIKNGVIIPDDDSSERGIRPRWAKVFQVSSDILDLTKGDYVLLKHGRWTRKIPLVIDEQPIDVWMIDYPDAVLLKTDEQPETMLETTKTF